MISHSLTVVKNVMGDIKQKQSTVITLSPQMEGEIVHAITKIKGK